MIFMLMLLQFLNLFVLLILLLVVHTSSTYFPTLVEAWQIAPLSIPKLRLFGSQTKYKYKIGSEENDLGRFPSTPNEDNIQFIQHQGYHNSTTTSDDKVQIMKKPFTYLDTEKEIQRLHAIRKARKKLKLPIDATFARKFTTDKWTHIVNPLSLQTNTTRTPPTIVTNVEELRRAVLDNQIELNDILFHNVSFASNVGSKGVTKKKEAYDDKDVTWIPLDHEVIKLMEFRSKTNSKPGSRANNDTAHLALSIEGGGMRGAVSAGMASAIAVLGLSDVFDSIYGSSAGSVVGAYMVSRQMCIDVYTDVLTAAKTKFVSKGRLASSLATNLLDHKVLNRSNMMNNTVFSNNVNPPMNISFVLDSIMDPQNGLRPLDLKAFGLNDKYQPLRIVTSAVRNGKMETHCLGSKNMDFFDRLDENGNVIERATTMLNGKRHGLFACLETSMTVPAATGPPLPMMRNKDAHMNIPIRCFDAFCFEPIPYRSAVKEGATHVLVLKTRPNGNPIGTKPGLFEKIFAPTYFDGNGMPQVSNFFSKGGQQYIYIEDYLTLDQAKCAGPEGVLVPPTNILYGVEPDEVAKELIQNRNKWKRAHLYPLAVPPGRPELSTLSVEKDEVLMAVRDGFAVAFDLLAPIANIQLKPHMNGQRVADLIFSNTGDFQDVLLKPMPAAGNTIYDFDTTNDDPIRDFTMQSSPMADVTRHDKDSISKDNVNVLHEIILGESPSLSSLDHDAIYRDPFYFMDSIDPMDSCPRRDAHHLLNELPGFESGRMESLSRGLHHLRRNDDNSSKSLSSSSQKKKSKKKK